MVIHQNNTKVFKERIDKPYQKKLLPMNSQITTLYNKTMTDGELTKKEVQAILDKSKKSK